MVLSGVVRGYFILVQIKEREWSKNEVTGEIFKTPSEKIITKS